MSRNQRALRELREKHGLSVRELSEVTGYSAKHLWNVEAGRKNGSDGMLWFMKQKLEGGNDGKG